MKPGDYVLSKPESGTGTQSYKRVADTFEFDGKQVWYVAFAMIENGRQIPGTEEYLYVTLCITSGLRAG